MADIIDFSQWEQVLGTAKELVKATNFLFDIVDDPDPKYIQDDAFVNMIKLHNAAVDYIVSMKNIITDKED